MSIDKNVEEIRNLLVVLKSQESSVIPGYIISNDNQKLEIDNFLKIPAKSNLTQVSSKLKKSKTLLTFIDLNDFIKKMKADVI